VNFYQHSNAAHPIRIPSLCFIKSIVHLPKVATPFPVLSKSWKATMKRASGAHSTDSNARNSWKEINLMRRDSEAGQKCCAFQHWVYTQTEGNLLVIDMQGIYNTSILPTISVAHHDMYSIDEGCKWSEAEHFKDSHFFSFNRCRYETNRCWDCHL